MAVIPEKDQELIDQLQKKVQKLYDIEEHAARAKNERKRKAAHNEITKILKFIKDIVDSLINNQNL